MVEICGSPLSKISSNDKHADIYFIHYTEIPYFSKFGDVPGIYNSLGM
jgi:hypothetical protein